MSSRSTKFDYLLLSIIFPIKEEVMLQLSFLDKVTTHGNNKSRLQESYH